MRKVEVEVYVRLDNMQVTLILIEMFELPRRNVHQRLARSKFFNALAIVYDIQRGVREINEFHSHRLRY